MNRAVGLTIYFSSLLQRLESPAGNFGLRRNSKLSVSCVAIPGSSVPPAIPQKTPSIFPRVSRAIITVVVVILPGGFGTNQDFPG